jgi:hypothetical protein
MNRTIREPAASFAIVESVEALVLAGSMSTAWPTSGRTMIFTPTRVTRVPMALGARLLKPRAARLELHNTFWEWSDERIEPDGTVFDLIYRSCDAIEVDVEARLGRAEAAVATLPAYISLAATDGQSWTICGERSISADGKILKAC